MLVEPQRHTAFTEIFQHLVSKEGHKGIYHENSLWKSLCQNHYTWHKKSKLLRILISWLHLDCMHDLKIALDPQCGWRKQMDRKMGRQWDKRVWLWLFWVTGPYSDAHHWDGTQAMNPGPCDGSSRRQKNVSEVWAVAAGCRDPCIQAASSYGSWLPMLVWMWTSVWDCQQPQNSQQIQQEAWEEVLVVVLLLAAAGDSWASGARSWAGWCLRAAMAGRGQAVNAHGLSTKGSFLISQPARGSWGCYCWWLCCCRWPATPELCMHRELWSTTGGSHRHRELVQDHLVQATRAGKPLKNNWKLHWNVSDVEFLQWCER